MSKINITNIKTKKADKNLILILSLLLILVLLIFIIPFSSAELVVNKYSNDFALYALDNEQVKACQCEIKRDFITIENVGNFYSEYDVSAESDTAGWVKITNTRFSLPPKHKIEIPVYIEIPCGVTGIYDYVIRVSSNYGRVKYLERTIRTDKCQNSQLDVKFNKNETNLCEAVKMNVDIKNTGTFAETYKLSFGTFEEYINISQKEYYLQPQESKKIEATIKLPCEMYGVFEIPVILYSEKNKFENKIIKSLNVINQFDHSIIVDSDVEFCSRIPQTHSFTIKNEIDVPNNFEIMLKAPDFVSIDKRTLHLEGLASSSIVMNIKPEKGDEGEYKAKIIVTSNLGNIEKEKDFNIVVKNCYDFDTSIELYESPGVEITTDKTCCGKKNYLIKIQNKGETDEIYNIAIDGPSWIRAEENSVSLHPSEHKLVKIYADLPCSDESYLITFRVSLDRFKQVVEEKTLNISSYTQHTCHLIDIEEDEVSATKEDTIIPVIIKHKGVEGGGYKVELDNELYYIKETSFSLYPGESRALHLIAKDNVSNAEFGRYILKPEFSFIDIPEIRYEDHIGVKLKNISWLKRSWLFLIYGVDWGRPGWCGWLAIALLLIIGITAFLIIKFNKKMFVRKDRIMNFSLMAILGLLALVMVALFIFKPWPSHEYIDNGCSICKENSVVLTIEENSNLKVNLDNYFKDPDFDVLKYTATQPGHINTRIEENILTLTPEHNWVGEETLIITADDGKGGVKDSPVIYVRVLQKKEQGFWDIVKRYCEKILLIEFAILFGVLLAGMILCYIKREKFKKEQEKLREKFQRKIRKKK